MDFPVEKKISLESEKFKKPKKSLLKRAKAFGQEVKEATEQWWMSSNQIPHPLTPINDEISDSDLQKKMILVSVDDTTPSLKDNHLKDNRATLLRKRLFLIETEHPKLYQNAYQRLENFKFEMAEYHKTKAFNKDIKQPKYVHEPSAQLSHDGIALTSYLYALKDDSPKQPIVVKTFEGFEKIIRFIDGAPDNTAITLVVQFDTSFIEGLAKDLHRITMRLEKINSEIHAIYLDSVNTSNTLLFATMKLYAFMESLDQKGSKERMVHTYFEKDDRIRQNDEFQCTVFAIKDARELNKNHDSLLLFEDPILKNLSQDNFKYSYKVSPNYLKGLQSRTAQKAAVAEFGDEVVTRKGLTLKEVYAKHPNQSYIPHFSKKYETLVMACANSLTDAELDAAIKNYTAEGITTERLAAVYSNKSTPRKG